MQNLKKKKKEPTNSHLRIPVIPKNKSGNSQNQTPYRESQLQSLPFFHDTIRIQLLS